MAIPGIVGTATGGIAGSGNFTVTPPAGAAGYVAVGAWRGTTGQLTAPSGWTAVTGYPLQSGGDDYTMVGMWTAGATPGSSWNHGTTNGGASVTVVGYDGALTIHQTSGSSATLTCPTVTTTEGALILRAAMRQSYNSAPTFTYPTSATLGRDQRNQLAASEYWQTGVAHESRSATGATGTAAYTSTATQWSARAHTLALTTAGGGSDGTLTSVVGTADAAGGSTTITGDAAFTTAASTADATGGSSAFAVTGTIVTAASTATAEGGSSTFTGAAVFTTTAGTSDAAGGSSTFTGGGSATLTTTAGDATADGGAGSLAASSTFTTTGGDATGDGGTSTLTAGATLATTAADATADGAEGTFTAGSVLPTTGGTATADGGVGAFSAGGSVNLATTVGVAVADGGTGVLTATATFTTTVGEATADGDQTTFGSIATFTTQPGDAAAAGGIANWAAAALWVTLTATADAAGLAGDMTGFGAFTVALHPRASITGNTYRAAVQPPPAATLTSGTHHATITTSTARAEMT